MYALLSVSNKDGIIEFAKGLKECGYQILSTSGTLKALQDAQIEVIDIASYTGSVEMFEGRVKTLNPKIAGGILYRRDKDSHCQDAKRYEIGAIDIVCVNLYPFKQTIERTQDFEEIIENIDIGGPSMIRAAAKNFQSVLVLTDPTDYAQALNHLKNNQNTLQYRQEMMIKAFEHTANYDCVIANYMNERFNGGFGNQSFVSGAKMMLTRYGENPHQKGALYMQGKFFEDFEIIKGEPSFNNFTDLDSALKISNEFQNSVCIIKHGNPCGFAINANLLEAYKTALSCDSLSAFGGVVAVNAEVREDLAEEISKMFIEAIIAPKFSKQALNILQNKKSLKLFSLNHGEFFNLPRSKQSFRSICGGFLLQESDVITQEEILNAKQMGDFDATPSQKRDLEIAYKIASFTKSNCVAYVKNEALVAIGMGMTSRVDASRAALLKAKDMGLEIEGCVLASEAFFPFKDSIELAAKEGVSAIIQPGGSIRDDEVIECANSHKIPIFFTFKRHFLH